jgi:hypothetical protein
MNFIENPKLEDLCLSEVDYKTDNKKLIPPTW